MAIGITISSDNFNGSDANITFSGYTGGTVNIGNQTLPYTYINPDYSGVYTIYIPLYNKTCELVVGVPLSPTPTPTITATPTSTPSSTPPSTPTPTPTPSSIASGITEADAFLTEVDLSGGTLDATISAATRTFFVGLMSNNLWDKLYAMYPFIGGVAASHSIDARGTYNMTWYGGITHSSNGVIGNGTNGYGDTSLSPDSVIGDGNASSMGIYVNVEGTVGTRTYDAGSNDGAGLNQQLNIAARRSGSNEALFDAGNYFPNTYGRVSAVVASSSGMTIGVGRSSTDRELYKNGSSIATQTNSESLTYSTNNVYFAAQNEGGSPNWYNSNTYGFFFIGKNLTGTDVSNLSSLINDYQTSLGRNTY